MSNICPYCPPQASLSYKNGTKQHFEAWHKAGHPKLTKPNPTKADNE